MPAPGYVTHAAENRRRLWQVLGLFVLAFEMIGGLAIMMLVVPFDPDHTLLVNPVGYFVRYGIPVALLSGGLFAWLYAGHADELARKLAIRPASRIDDPRFVRIAGEQCIALGIRVPRFGVIEVPQPNALAVGEGPSRGMIAVTRGLLDQLDDDELAAVIAHECSHIRNGDTRVLAANYALMRTVVLLQINNPLRFEDWRQLLIPLLLPPMLVVMLLSGMITKASLELARMARRSVKLSRDHIADGEAVRVTHRPDALHSAIARIGGKGAFAGSRPYDDLLFDGRADAEGGTHPSVVDRLSTISRLGRDLMQPGRQRRDTRDDALRPADKRPVFGRRYDATRFAYQAPPEEPAPVKPRLLRGEEVAKLMFTDFKAYRAYLDQCNDWFEWRSTDGRNFLGLKPEMSIWVAAMTAFLLILHWPSSGDWRDYARTFSPTFFLDIYGQTGGGTFCSGPSYPDGKCPGS